MLKYYKNSCRIPNTVRIRPYEKPDPDPQHWFCAGYNRNRGDIHANFFQSAAFIFLVTDLGGGDSGIGLSYRPVARLHKLACRYDNPMPESTISSSRGPRIWALVLPWKIWTMCSAGIFQQSMGARNRWAGRAPWKFKNTVSEVVRTEVEL